MRDIQALSTSLLDTFKGFVERKTALLWERLSAVERKLDELPTPKDGHTPTPEELQPLVATEVERAVGALPAPKDGHTPTPEELQPLVATEVERAVQPLQQRAAADAESMLGRIRLVERKLEELPTPKDGHTPTPEELQPLVATEVERAVGALPAPKDGHTPTPEELQPLVATEVERAVGALPTPKDGASVTPDDLRPMLAEMLGEALKSLPKPADGRDALDLHVLPVINPEKSYPRGTYAKHLGGLWRAFEPTDGMRGWECIVEGVKSVDVEQQGERKFVVTTITSSGATTVKEFKVPVMVYRGIFNEESTYDEGDTVTWAGSTWVARSVTSDKPGQSDAWRLAVKKGRDGKDAEGVKL